jgi:hypothetical protein
MLVPKGAEEGLFKPTTNGWIFSAPNPWTFARRRSYLVTSAQKAEIAQRVRRALAFRLLAFIPILAMTGITFFLFPSLLRHVTYLTWLAFALLIVCGTVVINLCDYLMTRRSLAGLPRTTERISQLDMYRRQAQSMSVARLVTLTAIETIAFILVLAAWLMLPRASGLLLLNVVMLGALAILFAVMLVAKLRSQPAVA